MTTPDITAALQAALPPALQSQAPGLADLLASVGRGEVALDVAQARLAAEFPLLLQALAGKSVPTPTSVIASVSRSTGNPGSELPSAWTAFTCAPIVGCSRITSHSLASSESMTSEVAPSRTIPRCRCIGEIRVAS